MPDELGLIPGEVRLARETRIYSREEIAQTLINAAVTSAGIEDAKLGILELGLDPDDFSPNR